MRRSRPLRPLTTVAGAALVAGALVGCTGSLFGECEPAYRPGDASATITATGDVGESPEIGFPTPLISTTPERTVLVRGDGPVIAAGDAVAVEYTLMDASSGDVLQASGYEGATTQGILNAGEAVPVLGDALVCAHVGARIATVLPTEALSEDFDDETELSGRSYVLVIDVMQVWRGKADGLNQLPQDGMPTVVTAVDGTPGIGVGALAVPEETRTATIKAGGGEALESGDVAVVHLREFSWSANNARVGQIDTWENHTPARLDVDPDAAGSIPVPVIEALIGATAGSQLLVVIPDGSGGASVFVVDLLGIDHVE